MTQVGNPPDGVPIPPPPQVPAKKAEGELDEKIAGFVNQLMPENNLTLPEKVIIAGVIYHLNEDQVSSLPPEKMNLIIKTRSLYDQRLGLSEKTSTDVTDGLEAVKRTVPSPQVKFSQVMPSLMGVNVLTEKGSSAFWGAAVATGEVSKKAHYLKATISLNLVSASIAMGKTIKDGVSYFHQKIALMKMEKRQVQLNTELSAQPSGSDENTLHSTELQKELRQVNQSISDHKKSMEEIRGQIKSEALINTAYFTGSVVEAAAATTAAAITGATLGGVVFGGLMVYTSSGAIVQGAKEEKALNQIDSTLSQKEKVLQTTETNNTPPEVGSVLRGLVNLKRKSINNHFKKEIWHNRFQASLATATGIAAMEFGLITIIAKVGVVIAVGAIAGSGIGLAVLIGLGLLVGCCYIAYNYYKRQQGLMPKIREKQKELVALQKNQEEHRMGLTNSVDFSIFEKYLEESLAKEKKIESCEQELESLVIEHKLQSRVGDMQPQAFIDLETLDEANLDLLLSKFTEEFPAETEVLLIPFSGLSFKEKKAVVKKYFAYWVTSNTLGVS
jgi:hypothetical protein